MTSLLFLSIPAVFFFVFKLANIGIRLSDTNIYFATALKILEGKTLYKDIFFTNLPLFPYFSTLYLLLSSNNIYFYYLTSTIEVVLISFLIFIILDRKYKNSLIPIAGFLSYLFSFVILATSDHQTGVFLASFFSVLSYFFLEKKKMFLSGAFIGLSIVTKAYFAPIVLAFAIYIFLKNRKDFLIFSAGTALSVLAIILPFLIFAKKPFIDNIFIYSLTRSQGISKTNIFLFFIKRDFLFFVIFLFNLLNFRKSLFFGLISFFSIIFVAFYQDLYYLYLNFFIPFLSLSLGGIFAFFERFKIRKFELYLFLAICGASIFNIGAYLKDFSDLQKIDNIKEIAATIQKERPDFLYGINSLTPALHHLTGVKLLNGIIDTNENIFRKKLLNARKLTKDAVDRKTIIVSEGIDYPQLNIRDDMVAKIFDGDLIKKNCEIMLRYPIRTEGAVNRIILFKCF